MKFSFELLSFLCPVQHLLFSAFEGDQKVIFFLYDCYVLDSKYNYQKMFLYI